MGTDEPERWRVKNYDGIERGPISLREALWWSDNTVFTDLVMNANGRGLENGPEAIADVANRLGISTNFPDHPNPSIVLGAYEVSPLDMATAYATIANGGRRVEPTMISRVVSDEGKEGEKVLYEAPDHPGEAGNRSRDSPRGYRDHDWRRHRRHSRGRLPRQPARRRQDRDERELLRRVVRRLHPAIANRHLDGVRRWRPDPRVRSGVRPRAERPLRRYHPAEIWKTYMEQMLEGQPIEQFEGVEMPTQEHTTPTDAATPGTEPSGAAGPRVVEPLPAGILGDRPTNVEPSSASPSSAAPSGVPPSSAAPSSAAPSSASPSSANPSRRPGGRGLR